MSTTDTQSLDTKSWQHHRGRLAHAVRVGDQETADAARRDLRVARAEDYIRRLVDEAPPLTAAQRARLAALLAPSESGR